MRRCKQIALAAATLLVMVVAPFPDGQSVSHPPLVITADTSIFKAKPDDRTLTYSAQPSVYCGVTVC
jgi:hypothetical protein